MGGCDRGQGARRGGGSVAAHRRRRICAAVLAALASLLVGAAGWPASGLQGQYGGVPAPGSLASLAGSATGRVPGGEALPPPQVAPLRRLRQVDLLVVSPVSLPSAAVAAVSRLPGVAAVESVDAARVTVNGRFVAVLGVDPWSFRGFAARPTAADTGFWQSVADGDFGVSYTMGRQDKLPLGTQVAVTGRQRRTLTVGGLRTVGIAGVDGVVSHAVARSLGFPMGNALVISAPHAKLAKLTARIKAAMPSSALVEQLVVPQAAARAGQAGSVSGPALSGELTYGQLRAMLRAALSRVGMPYVWGGAGPSAFDCSGLVQWSFAQAGVVMPRVAADQARTGPAVPVSRLAAGDLLFYHTDPTAPGYISHVAIYLGNGWMVQAPQPGMRVEVVPVLFGSEYAGAVAVSPRVAVAVAASPVG